MKLIFLMLLPFIVSILIVVFLIVSTVLPGITQRAKLRRMAEHQARCKETGMPYDSTKPQNKQ